jgi:pimeloyl-ACP methyl ester carboxylesterase
MQQFLAKQQPPVLVATGANDEIFPEPVVRRVRQDLPAAEYHALPTGHFALEDHAPEIAALIRGFLPRALA